MVDTNLANFVHWILYNLSSSTTAISQGSSSATAGPNGYGNTGYGGPCPPTGENHTYQIKLWALDIADLTQASGFQASSSATTLTVLDQHDLATATLSVTYTGP